MASCPQCGQKLRLYNWSPECPACGVNLNYYDANQRLLDEAERAEKEHALFQPRIDRAKASFFGSPWAIARIVLTLLPLICAFLPLFRLAGPKAITTVNAMEAIPLPSEEGVDPVFSFAIKEEWIPLFRLAAPKIIASGSAAQVYQYLSAKGFGDVFSAAMKGDPLSLAAALLLLSLIMILVCLICTLMSLGKHGKARNLILNLILLGCGAGAAVCFLRTEIPSSLPGYTSGALGWGAFIYIGLLAALLIYNLYLARRGLPAKKTPCYIGGLPCEEYFRYVEEGMSPSEIRRKMLLALAELREEQERELAAEGGNGE